METYTPVGEVTNEAIIRGSFGDPKLRGPFWQNESWNIDLRYTPEAEESLRLVVTPRTELGSRRRDFVPIPPALARELGLPIPPVGLDS